MSESKPVEPTAPPFTPVRLDEPIVTERLTLRPLRPDDVDDVHAYQRRDDVCEWLLYEPQTRQQVADKIARWDERDRLETEGDFVQLGVEIGGRVVGDLYFTLKSEANRTAEIGWVFHPDHRGRGYATEGARALLSLAFDRMALHRVMAEYDPRNAASIALCERLGMRAEAHFRGDLWFRGAWVDTGMHAILDHEWRALGLR